MGQVNNIDRVADDPSLVEPDAEFGFWDVPGGVSTNSDLGTGANDPTGCGFEENLGTVPFVDVTIDL